MAKKKKAKSSKKAKRKQSAKGASKSKSSRKKKSAKKKSTRKKSSGKKSPARKKSAGKKKQAATKTPAADAPSARKKSPAASAPEHPAPVPVDQRKARVLARGGGVTLETGRNLLYLSRSDIESLPWEPGEVYRHAEIALRELGRGKVEMPPQVALYPQREALLGAKPALVPNVQACGLKWFSSYPQNLSAGIPQVSAMCIVSDHQTGLPLAVMDATWLTAQRGAAVSAVAAARLAREGSRTAAIIGAGVQGRNHIPALVSVLGGLELITVYDVKKSRANEAAKGWRGKLGRKVRIEPVAEPADAVRDADVLVSATRVTAEPEPIVWADWIRSGALVLPLDLDAVFDPEVFERADRVYVDSPDDLEQFRAKGLFAAGLPDHVSGTLGELVAEKIEGRGADAERIVCMNVGVACVDVVLARAIYEKAVKLGVGTPLDL